MNSHFRTAVVVLCAITNIVLGQSCPFTITSSADYMAPPTCTNISGDTWDIDIYLEHNGTASLTIIANDTAGGNDPYIGNLNVQIVQTGGNSPPVINCDLTGPTLNELNLAGLDSLTVDANNEGQLILRWLMVGGDVGTIECHGATKMSGGGAATSGIFIAGDVSGGVSLLNTPGSAFFADRIDELIVDGDFLGYLTNDGQKAELSVLRVTGDIGTPASPCNIDFFHTGGAASIGTIECDNMYVDMDVHGSLRRIDTQGVFVGDINCISMLNTAGLGEGDPGVFIGSGDLSGLISTFPLGNQFDADIIVPGNVTTAGSISLSGVPSGRTISIAGDLDGPVMVGSVVGSIEIGGDVSAKIIVGSPVADADLGGSILIEGHLEKDDIIIYGSVSATGEISILGEQLNGIIIFDDFAGAIDIGTTGGLTGQTVVNARNDTGAWLGNLTVATTVLGPAQSPPYLSPFYEALSSTLGGGAIGLVPFMYHAVESVPEHGSTIFSIPSSVTIEHYGPIADGDPEDETPPVKVYRASLLSSPGNPPPDIEGTEVCDSMWTDVTSSYAYSISGRALTITGTFVGWRAYQVVPNDLVCDIVNEPGITYAQGWEGSNGCGGTESYGYGFRITPGFDMNMNGMLEGGDIETWLATPADFDGDEDADNVDLILLVDAVTNGGE